MKTWIVILCLFVVKMAHAQNPEKIVERPSSMDSREDKKLQLVLGLGHAAPFFGFRARDTFGILFGWSF